MVIPGAPSEFHGSYAGQRFRGAGEREGDHQCADMEERSELVAIQPLTRRLAQTMDNIVQPGRCDQYYFVNKQRQNRAAKAPQNAFTSWYDKTDIWG